MRVSKDNNMFQYEPGSFYVSDDIVTLIHQYHNIDIHVTDEKNENKKNVASRYKVEVALPVATISTSAIEEASTLIRIKDAMAQFTYVGDGNISNHIVPTFIKKLNAIVVSTVMLPKSMPKGSRGTFNIRVVNPQGAEIGEKDGWYLSSTVPRTLQSNQSLSAVPINDDKRNFTGYEFRPDRPFLYLFNTAGDCHLLKVMAFEAVGGNITFEKD